MYYFFIQIRAFRNSLIFSFLGIDEDGIEIRVSAFDEFAKEAAAAVRIGQVCPCH